MHQSTLKVFYLKVFVERILEVCTYPVCLKDKEDMKMSTVIIEISPQIALDEVQVSFLVPGPLRIIPQVHHFSNLMEKTFCVSYAHLHEHLNIQSIELCIVTTVVTNLGIPSCLVEHVQLPLKWVAQIENGHKEAEHKITLIMNQKPVPLTILFSGK